MRVFVSRIAVFLAIFVVVGELFFRSVIPAAELPVSRYDDDYRILRYDSASDKEGLYTSGRYAQSRGTWRINGQGWNSHREYVSADERNKPAVAYFGSSYLEGFYSNLEDNLAYVMEEQANGRYDVYNLSMSESVSSEHLEVAKYARDLFAPDVLVFFSVPGQLAQTIQNATGRQRWKLENGVVSKRPVVPRDYTLRAFARNSAILRYLVLNARLPGAFKRPRPPKKVFAVGASSSVNTTTETSLKLQTLAEYLVKQAVQANPKAKIIFVTGYAHVSETPPEMGIEGRFIAEACKTHGADHIDITKAFHEDWIVNHKRFTFEHNRHWNAYAFTVIAKRLTRYLDRQNL